jgi:hypothetical protein
MKVPVFLRRLVIQRAEDRCEYCGISQLGQVATFHIDHIIPSVAGGETTAENLALEFARRFQCRGRHLPLLHEQQPTARISI